MDWTYALGLLDGTDCFPCDTAAKIMCHSLFVRNPMIPAAVVMVWENLNPFLPNLFKQISVIFYLTSLCPVTIDVPPPFSVLVTDTNPAPAWIAVPGLLLVSTLVLAYAARSARRAEINYAE